MSSKRSKQTGYINGATVVKQVAKENDSIRLMLGLDSLKVAAHIDVTEVLIDDQRKAFDPIVRIDILKSSVMAIP